MWVAGIIVVVVVVVKTFAVVVVVVVVVVDVFAVVVTMVGEWRWELELVKRVSDTSRDVPAGARISIIVWST